MAGFATPSRSRKTAGRMFLEPPRAGVFEHGMHRDAQRLARRAAAGPSQAADAVGDQANHGDVALPAAVTASLFELRALFRTARDSDCQPCHFGNRYGIIAGAVA